MLLKTFEFFHTVNIQHQFNKQEKIFSASENRNFSWKIPKTEIKSQELNLYWSSHLKNCPLVNKNQLIIHKGKKKGVFILDIKHTTDSQMVIIFNSKTCT